VETVETVFGEQFFSLEVLREHARPAPREDFGDGRKARKIPLWGRGSRK
jgi:hypothetical protein